MFTLMSLAATPVLAQYVGGNILYLGILFFIFAIIAYAMGARGMAGMSASIGRTLMFIFLILFVISLILSFTGHGF